MQSALWQHGPRSLFFWITLAAQLRTLPIGVLAARDELNYALKAASDQNHERGAFACCVRAAGLDGAVSASDKFEGERAHRLLPVAVLTGRLR